jgi:uncharacterized membrane protein
MEARMRSTANIGGHPIHPMLIPLPIGLLIAAFVCDLAYWGTGNAFWANVAFWALIAGVVTALVAALFGFADFFGDRAVRQLSDAWQHMIGNLIAVVLAIVSIYLRYRGGIEAAVFPWGIATSFLVALILVFTGWKGGQLTFRHHVGVVDVIDVVDRPPR